MAILGLLITVGQVKEFLYFCLRCTTDLDSEIGSYLPTADKISKPEFIKLVREAEAKVIDLHEGAKDRFHHEVIATRMKRTGNPNIPLAEEGNIAMLVMNYRKGLADALRRYKELISKLLGEDLEQPVNSTIVVADLEQ